MFIKRPFNLETLATDIITPRLVLRLMDSAVVKACLHGDLRAAGQRLGVPIPGELLERPSSLQYNLKLLADDPEYLLWSVRAIILADEKLMIGIIRFHSQPGAEYLRAYAEGAVEFGYRIFTQYRKLGYATEALEAVMAWAEKNFNVQKFIASVSPANIPSLRLIARFGFVKVGEEVDDIDGIEHVFLLDKTSVL